MALINCPECETEISDKAQECVKCGNPLIQTPISQPDTPPQPRIEKIVNRAVDIIFTLMYAAVVYGLATSKDIELASGAAIFGLIIGFALIYFTQKIAKGVLGTVARSFDSMVKR